MANTRPFSFSSNVITPSFSPRNEKLFIDNISSVIPSLNDSVKNVFNRSSVSTWVRPKSGRATPIPIIEVTPPTPVMPNKNKSFLECAVDSVTNVGNKLNTYCGRIRRFSDPCILGKDLPDSADKLQRRASVPEIRACNYLKVPRAGSKRKQKRRESLPQCLGSNSDILSDDDRKLICRRKSLDSSTIRNRSQAPADHETSRMFRQQLHEKKFNAKQIKSNRFDSEQRIKTRFSLEEVNNTYQNSIPMNKTPPNSTSMNECCPKTQKVTRDLHMSEIDSGDEQMDIFPTRHYDDISLAMGKLSCQ